mgnify:CR=1 FL=1
MTCGLMIAVCAGTTVGMNALLSRSLGAKEQDKADQAANTGIFLALCSFVLFCVIGVFFSRTFFQLQTDVTEIVSSGTIYAQICLGCSIGIFCQFTFERLLQSTGRTHLSMCTQLLGALTNIILDPILIFGLFGAPRLGVAGAAVATVTGQCVAAVAALIMNLKCNPDIHIVPRKIRFHGPTVKNIYRIGFPSIVMQCIGSVMVFGVNRILISFTTTATAVFGAYFKLQTFIFMPIFGISSGLIPILSYNYGSGALRRVSASVRFGQQFTAVLSLSGALLLSLLASPLLRSAFRASPEALAMGAPALRIIALSFFFAGTSIIFCSAFQSLGRSRWSLLVALLRQILLLLPAAALLLALKPALVWAAFPLSELISCFAAALLYRRTIQKQLL